MNILLVSNIFPPGFVGGYELGAYEVAQGLADQGHAVTVLTSDYFLDERLDRSPLPVIRSLTCATLSHELGNQGARQLRGSYHQYCNIRRIAHSIRTLQIDLVLLFNIQGLGALSILRFLSATGMPSLVYLMDSPLFGIDRHSLAYQKYESVFGPNKLDSNIRYIAMSTGIMDEFNAVLGQTRAPDLVVPGWIHLDKYSPARPSLRTDSHTRFVFCSRIAGHKGIDLVLDAAEELSRQGTRDFSIDFYGQGQVAQFIQSIRARGLDQYVFYRGSKSKDEMLRTFESYDALVFPTWEREPFGFVVSEAAAAGCVPIMTAAIGASAWFLHEFDCLKIARSSGALRNAMYQIIAMGPEARLELRLSAMQSARRFMPFSRWLPAIERECRTAASLPATKARRATTGVQAAFQFLGHLWKESLH